MDRWLKPIEALTRRRAVAFGGKARGLAALERGGFPVPRAFALSSDASEAFIRSVLTDDAADALRQQPRMSLSAGQLREFEKRVASASIPRPIEQLLVRAFEELVRAGARAVVVRSSALLEDLDVASAAGLHRTVLNVRTFAGLRQAVRDCWSSLFQSQTISYRPLHDLPLSLGMGLVIQEFVEAELSGVIFTANPLTSDPSEIVLHAAYGLAEPIMDGRVSPDTWRIDKYQGELRDSVVGSKHLRAVAGKDGTIADEDVDREMAGRFCLSEGWVDELTNLALRVERHFRSPRDIEWSIARGKVYVLQARSISTLGVATRPPRSSRSVRRSPVAVWSNVNVGEALSGPATPLTWSVLSQLSEVGFRNALGALGCAVRRDARFVGNFRGRIYLNLTELVASLRQIPGLDARALVELGGGGQGALVERIAPAAVPWKNLKRAPWVVGRFVTSAATIRRRLARFEAEYQEEYAHLSSVDPRVLSPRALSYTIRDVERLLESCAEITLTCYGQLLARALLLRRLIRSRKPRNGTGKKESDALHAAGSLGFMLSGSPRVVSAASGPALFDVACIARDDPEARRVLETTAPGSLGLDSLPPGPTRTALHRFLDQYGSRGAREAELAAPRWREDPELLFAVLQQYLRGSGEAGRSATPASISNGTDPWEIVKKDLPVPLRLPVRALLRSTHRSLELREQLRAKIVDVLGLLRELVLDVGRRLEQRDARLGSDAAFFLTIREVHQVLEDPSMVAGPIVDRRRVAFEREGSLPDPPQTFVGVPPFMTDGLPARLEGGFDVLGVGASGGRAEGCARVLRSERDVADMKPGDVLVVPHANVGWAPVFPLASAVVTELGGMLSHAAVVLREYGIPAVLNAPEATKVIRSGDHLVVDGDQGVVHVEPAQTPPPP